MVPLLGQGVQALTFFDGANYEGLADGLVLAPNVTIDDDVTFQNATVTIPQGCRSAAFSGWSR